MEPRPDDEIGFLGAREMADALSRGDTSSREVVRVLLERIAALDDATSEIALNSIAAISPHALADAERCDEERSRGEVRGSLHGVPVLIKDNIEATGLPATAGSSALVARPSLDAPLVERLRRAGAIVMGSTNLSQWANVRSPRSTSGWSATGGLVANPWALDRSAGGSSSGSGAAVAAGLSPLAIGTETDGSIVCPASVNGVVGLKATVGTLPTQRIVPISASQDAPGPLARSVGDVALAFHALSPETNSRSTDRLRFAVATTWTTGHPGTDLVFGALVERLGAHDATVIEREVATPGEQEGHDELTVMLAELVDDLSSYLAARPGDGVRSLADVVAYENAHAELEMPYFGHELFDMALASGGRRADAYGPARARNLEWATNVCLGPAMADVDVLIAPAYAPAWKSDLVIGGHPANIASCASTPAAIAGWPIMSVPMGFVEDLPVGVALIGRPCEEHRLLDAAAFVESVVRASEPVRTPTWRPSNRG